MLPLGGLGFHVECIKTALPWLVQGKAWRLTAPQMNMGGLYADVGDHEEIAITKDLFLLIIQDALMWLKQCH